MLTWLGYPGYLNNAECMCGPPDIPLTADIGPCDVGPECILVNAGVGVDPPDLKQKRVTAECAWRSVIGSWVHVLS